MSKYSNKIIYATNEDYDWTQDDEYIEKLFLNYEEVSLEWDNDWQDENGDVFNHCD